MGLTILTAAPVTGLVEVATVRSRLGLGSDAADATHDQLAELVDEVSSLIIAEFGRDLVRQEYQETKPETGRLRWCLDRYPIDPDSLVVKIGDTTLTVDVDYSVESARRGILYRASGWGSPSPFAGEDNEARLLATYYAGYLVGESETRVGVVSTWTAGAAYVAHSWARPLALAKASPLRFECTTAGTAGGSEPAWPTIAGDTVTDGTAEWTAREASDLPASVRSIAWLAVQNAYTQLERQAGLASRSAAGFSESYFATHTELELPPNVLRSIALLRETI